MRVGITGHRRLPEETAGLVRAALEDVVRNCASDDLIGVSCIADGPDAWFAEIVIAHGGGLESSCRLRSTGTRCRIGTTRCTTPSWIRPRTSTRLD